MSISIVEVAGVEPASKQGARKLSTRLSAVWSFSRGLAGGNLTPSPVPLISHAGRNPPSHYLQIDDTPYGQPLRSGTVARDTRRQAALDPAIKLIFLEN